MPHPLLGSLLELSNDELHQKYADLTKKLNSAYRMGMGDAVQQLQMFIEDYQAEIRRRNDKMIEEMSKKSAEFKNIIDIQ